MKIILVVIAFFAILFLFQWSNGCLVLVNGWGGSGYYAAENPIIRNGVLYFRGERWLKYSYTDSPRELIALVPQHVQLNNCTLEGVQ